MPRRRFQPFDPGRYIVLYGPSGSGKSTLARRIGERLGLPVIELDAVFHGPNWQDLDAETFRSRVRELLDRHRDGWIVEGNYRAVRDLILPHASTAVWLRLPFHVVYPRLLGRTVARIVDRRELWNGNRETLRLALSRESILLWGITSWRPHRREMREALRGASPGTRIFVLRNPRQVREWFDALRPAGPVS